MRLRLSRPVIEEIMIRPNNWLRRPLYMALAFFLCCASALAGTIIQSDVEECWKVFGFESQLRASLDQMFNDPDGLSLDLSREQMDEFWERLQKSGTLAKIEAEGKNLIIKNFSSDERKALAEFYSSPAGRSIIAKMPKFTAEANLMLNEEFLPAARKILGEMNQRHEHH